MNLISKRLLKRFAYYAKEKKKGWRSPEYHQHKDRYVIPNLLQALRRHQQGLGSVCSGCGAPIPEARLEAVPGAVRCVVCQIQHEQ
jgi:phage/conjugal plasmid C-4 type zinc finger TraR family protein